MLLLWSLVRLSFVPQVNDAGYQGKDLLKQI